MMLRAILLRGLAFALIWWALAEGQSDSWGVGSVSIGLALFASLRLSPPGGGGRGGGAPDHGGLSLFGLLGFIGFFIVQSVRGGVQVAARALRPKMDLAPSLLEFPLHLPPGPPRVLLVYTLNLLPGTISVMIVDDILRLHVFDRRMPIEAELRAVEARIARIAPVLSMRRTTE
jgi:multicomponent Na+:H+ antiporter subunit E